MYKFRTQNALFRYYNFKKILSYFKSAPSNLYICKFWEEAKLTKFGTKNSLFGYFWATSLNYYCHIWNQHPQICLTAKFSKITKTPKFRTKNPFFGYFWARIYKNCFRIWNQHPQICQNEYLCHTVNFGIGSAFSIFPSSAFSEGPGPGPGPRFGPLYNLYLTLVWRKGSNLK